MHQGTTVSFNLSATDADIPANLLTYTLAGAPDGANLNLTNGLFTWTPAEAQANTTNLITAVATDDGVPSLSATQSFMVTVREVNIAPILMSVPNRMVHVGTTISFALVATDADDPANMLTYSLSNAPPGASLTSTNIFTWSGVENDVDTTNIITASVTDDGTPSLSASISFIITVVSRPVIQSISIASNEIRLVWSSIPTNWYRLQYKSNFLDTNWLNLPGDVQAATNSTTKMDSSILDPQRFYRVLVLP